ncbi:MAG: cytochrome P450 [Myxococcota bacterium]
MTVPIPRPRGTSLGAVIRLSRDPLAALDDLRAECGDTWLVELPFMSTVVLSDPAAIHTVLVKDFRHYRKDFFTRQLTPVLGEGLLLSEGDTWRRNRRLAQPGFHAAAIRGYARAMAELTESAIDGWGPRRELDLHAEMMQLTLRIVARTLFGHEIRDEAEVVGAALDVFMETHRGVANTGFMLPPWLPTRSNHRHAAAVAAVDRVVYRMIDQHRADPDPNTLLGMLIAATDDAGGLSDRELRDEAVTLLMAGHETTAVALTMALYLVSQHPNVEARLQAEVDAVLADRAPGLADLPQLPYVRAVIFEAMRLYPPVWSVGREALCDTVIGDHAIPRGTHLWIAQWLTHRDPRWFADPLAFRPERWLDGTLERSVPDGAFFPFGAGPRVCIGKRFAELEAIVVLAAIARRYAVRLAPGEALRLSPSITLRPEGGLRLVATARDPIRRAA